MSGWQVITGQSVGSLPIERPVKPHRVDPSRVGSQWWGHTPAPLWAAAPGLARCGGSRTTGSPSGSDLAGHAQAGWRGAGLMYSLASVSCPTPPLGRRALPSWDGTQKRACGGREADEAAPPPGGPGAGMSPSTATAVDGHAGTMGGQGLRAKRRAERSSPGWKGVRPRVRPSVVRWEPKGPKRRLGSARMRTATT